MKINFHFCIITIKTDDSFNIDCHKYVYKKELFIQNYFSNYLNSNKVANKEDGNVIKLRPKMTFYF